MDKIDIDQAEPVLKRMLASAGADQRAADLAKVWSVFKDFCRTIEVRTPSDMVLFEIGVFNVFGAEYFHLHFVR